MNQETGCILVVDDYKTNRLKLSIGLKQQGHVVGLAENGRQALDMLRSEPYDLVLLDIVMPEMDGYEVLAEMKADKRLRNIPVIVISAEQELDSVVKGIELGADDYLPKSFNPIILKAKITGLLEKKRWRDKEKEYLEQIQVEQEKSERLLLNILPKLVAERLKDNHQIIADDFESVTVLFADIVGFTNRSAQIPASELVTWLNEIFSTFDALAEKHRLEKIKTIGDAYMVAGGLPTPCPDHTQNVANMALDMLAVVEGLNNGRSHPFNLRIGIDTGPVVAGVIGTRKFIYDLWGDTVNTASRMESHGLPGKIQVTQAVYEQLQHEYAFEERGLIEVKGKDSLLTYFMLGQRGKVSVI